MSRSRWTLAACWLALAGCDDEKKAREGCAGDDDTTCDGADDDCDGQIDEDATWADYYSDADGDGHGDGAPISACAPGEGLSETDDDCDDADEAVFPGATEVCDGVDNDCDELVDDADGSVTDAGAWYFDGDGDNFGSGPAFHLCEGAKGWAESDGDCDDADATAYPEAEEACDGVDNDCDGLVDGDDPDGAAAATWYYDADGDGYGDPDNSLESCDPPTRYVEDATDCDDARGSVHPGATEVCNDGHDNDCDGSGNDCQPYAGSTTRTAARGATIMGTGGTSSFGNWISAGDFDGDGVDDIVVSDTRVSAYLGAVLVYAGVGSGDTLGSSDATSYVAGSSSATYFGNSAQAVGDVTGDRYGDLVAFDNDATAWLIDGPITAARSVTSAWGSYAGVSALELTASPFAAGDLDDDGIADLVVGDGNWSSGGTTAGRVWVVGGPAATASGGDLDDYAKAVIDGASDGESFGTSVDSFDADGDGRADLAVASPSDSTFGYTYGGSVWVFDGADVSGAIQRGDASYFFAGDVDAGAFGWEVSGKGDYDGDGYGDLMVSGPNYDLYGEGGAFVFYGPVSSAWASRADVVLYGENRYFGYSAGPAGDIDDDGCDDLVVGELGYVYGTSSTAGAAHVFYGPMAGAISASAADATIADSTGSAYFGFRARAVGDVDDDGYDDFAVGMYGSYLIDVYFGGDGR